MDDDHTRNLYQQQVNINLNRQIEAQARALGGYSSSIPPLTGGTLPEGMAGAMRRLVKERDEAVQIANEWRAAADAWKHLAQTLRDETKACPNHEAHKIGQDDNARAKLKVNFENMRRLELGLNPHQS